MDTDEQRRQNLLDLRVGEQQQEMQTDISRLSAYGYRFPASFVGFKFDGPLVVALFTEHDPHQRDLPPLLEHPERVRIETSPHSRVQLEQTRDELSALLTERDPGSRRSMSVGLTTVLVSLDVDDAVFASELYQRYGDAIEVRLGNQRVDQAGDPVGPALQPRFL